MRNVLKIHMFRDTITESKLLNIIFLSTRPIYPGKKRQDFNFKALVRD